MLILLKAASAPAHAMFAGNPTPAQAASGNYRKPTFKWRGLTIAIENPAGSVRRGRNRNGTEWEVRMVFDYGEVRNTEGVDGDPVDVIVGQQLDAPMVYVVHQRKYGDWDAYDEDKCCIGFESEDAARAAFLANYNDPRFLGPITAMPVDEFVAKVRATKAAPAMIKALFFRALVSGHNRHTPSGGVVFVKPHADRRTAAHREVAAKFERHGDGFELRHRDGGRWALLMPDASHADKYRYQVYGADGFGQHHTFDSRDDALEDALANGYEHHDEGSLERMMMEPAWEEGMERQRAAGITNGEVVKALEALGIVTQ